MPTLPNGGPGAYYREDLRAVPTPQSIPSANAPQVANVPTLDMLAGCLGPLRAMHGVVKEVVVPGLTTPAGVINNPVLLAKNDQPVPMYVRVRLSQNGAQGQMAIGPTSDRTLSNMEWMNLTVNSNRAYECVLQNGEKIYGLGTWAGFVPLSIVVSVSTWNAGLGR